MPKLLTENLENNLKKLANINQEEIIDQVAYIHFYSTYFTYNAYVTYAIQENDDWKFYGYQSIGNKFEYGEILSLNQINELNNRYLIKNIQVIERERYFKKTQIKNLIKKGLININKN